jgi:hypothetical protein
MNPHVNRILYGRLYSDCVTAPLRHYESQAVVGERPGGGKEKESLSPESRPVAQKRPLLEIFFKSRRADMECEA